MLKDRLPPPVDMDVWVPNTKAKWGAMEPSTCLHYMFDDKCFYWPQDKFRVPTPSGGWVKRSFADVLRQDYDLCPGMRYLGLPNVWDNIVEHESVDVVVPL